MDCEVSEIDIYSVFMLLAVITKVGMPKRNSYKMKTYDDNKKSYIIVIGLLLFFIAALRAASVGSDSMQYANLFYRIQLMSVGDILQHYTKEPVFYFMIKIITVFSNHQWMFAVIGGAYAYSISRFIYKYSKDPMVSFIMLIPMMYFAFTLTGLRQTMAISIILLSYDYIIRKHLFKFVFTVIIASLFHQSALLFLPAYFISNKTLNNKKVLVGILGAPIVYVLRPQLVSMVQFLFYETYSIDLDQGAGGWTTLFVYFLIIIVAVVFSKQIKNEYFPFFLRMMYVGALIQMFVPLQPNIFRVSMYYNIVSIILIPDIIKTQKDKFSKLIAYSLFFILMGIQYYVFTYYAAGVQPYKFFWQ